MKASSSTYLGIVVALSALSMAQPAGVYAATDSSSNELENRLQRITATLQLRQQQSPETFVPPASLGMQQDGEHIAFSRFIKGPPE